MNKFSIKSILTEVLFDSKICESANQQNIIDFFYKRLLLEKLLVGEPVKVPELRKILHKKILNFEFIKLDGEVRPAKGTTMMKYIPTPDHPKGIRPSSPKVATFFDLDKKAWRSVSQRSKEIVLKYAFGEKGEKKPVFIVRDIDSTSTTEKPTFSEPSTTAEEDPFVSTSADQVDKEDIEDIKPVSMPDVDAIEKDDGWGEDYTDDQLADTDVEDVKPVSTPEVKPVSTPQVRTNALKPKYGWKIKKQHRPEHKPDIKIKPLVRPSISSVKTPTPPMPDETEVILPQEVISQNPFVRPSLPTKEPPLSIEPEEDEF